LADRSERIVRVSKVSETTFADVACAFPEQLNEALALMADPNTRGRLLAGGTDLMVQWEAGALPLPPRVISIKYLPELQTIEETADEVVIGAAVTHRQIRIAPLVQRHLPSLAEAAATVGGYQIQTMGTIGGNVANASPAGDLAPSILVAEGTVIVASIRGEREIPATAFWTGYRQIDLQPDEMIVRFRLPKMAAGAREYWRKLGPRRAQAISKVMGSCRGEIEDGVIRSFRIAVGSVAPTSVRLIELEQWLAGRTLDGETLSGAERLASEIVQPIDDIRSTAAYRKWITGRMVRGFLTQWT
jgi:CO/xanthine dehydrogenase FAD-binding subunit